MKAIIASTVLGLNKLTLLRGLLWIQLHELWFTNHEVFAQT